MYEQSQAHRIYEYHYKLNGLDVLKPGFHSVGSRCFRSEYQLFSLRGAGHFGVPTVELCPMMRFIQNHVSLSVRAGLALFGAVLLWSSSFIALKIAVSAFDPMVMVFGRMLSSLVALMLCG